MINAPTNLGPEISRGKGANLKRTIIKSIEIINSWQVGLQLAAIWAWEAFHVR